MTIRSASIAFLLAIACTASFAQGTGSWATGSDVLGLLVGGPLLIGIGILGIASVWWLLGCDRPYLLLIPAAVGIFYLKVWPADFCTGYKPCPGRIQVLGFLYAFLPSCGLTWLIAALVLPKRAQQRDHNDAT